MTTTAATTTAMTTNMFILYITFYTASTVNLLGYTPLLYIYIVDPDHKQGYFYAGETYLEVDVILMCWSMVVTCLEVLPHYQRFGPFALYAMLDLIISFTVCCRAILVENYNVPLIEDNIILFYFAVCISICYKMMHLFLVIAIIVHKDIFIILPPLPPPQPSQDGRGGGGGETVILLEEILPPPYESPPSYIEAMREEEKII